MNKRKAGIAKVPKIDPERVEAVLRWMIAGNRDADILTSIVEAWPDQAIAPLITAAVDQLEKSADFDSRVMIGWAFEATKEIYRRMVETGDLVGALRAVRQLTDLAEKHGGEGQGEGAAE